MSAKIYVLTDGKNTKIGITSRTIEKRLLAYQTHNASAQLVRYFNFSDKETALRIESAVKAFFRPFRVGTGQEWFSTSAAEIVEFISKLDHHLSQQIIDSPISISFHHAPVSDAAYDALNGIRKLLQTMEELRKPNAKIGLELENLRNIVYSEFARTFKLGISRADLENNQSAIIAKIEQPTADIKSAHNRNPKLQSSLVRDQPRPPKLDHQRNFYEIAPLSSGGCAAIFSAMVSMPYIDYYSDDSWRDIMLSTYEYSNDIGWYCTEHHDWSWHYPGRTGLVLFQPKTPIKERLKDFNESFRKFVIEREKVLKYCCDTQPEIEYAVEDIVRDSSFPLIFESIDDLYSNYINPVWGAYWSKKDKMRDAYEHLFSLWKNEQRA